MRRSTGYATTTVALIVPAMLAFWFAQYLIENFFPNVTFVDLGAFYAMGLVSGLATGLAWGLSRGSGDKR